MWKCAIRFTTSSKLCNLQTIPLMLSRHYAFRRRGAVKLDELDGRIDADTKIKEESQFKGLRHAIRNHTS